MEQSQLPELGRIDLMIAARHVLSRQEGKKKRERKNRFQLEAQTKEVLNVYRSWKGWEYGVPWVIPKTLGSGLTVRDSPTLTEDMVQIVQCSLFLMLPALG